MDKEKTELYTDYLICNQGLAMAASLSAMPDGEVSHLCPREGISQLELADQQSVRGWMKGTGNCSCVALPPASLQRTSFLS